MLEQKLIKKILNILLRGGGDFSEVFIQKRNLNNMRLDDGKIENSNSGFELGCGLRLINKDSTFYAYVDSIDKESLLNAAKILSSAVKSSAKNTVLNLSGNKSGYEAKVEQYPSDVTQENKKILLDAANKKARGFSKYIIQVSANLSDADDTIFIANSNGLLISESSVKVFLAVNVIAKKGSEIRTGYKSLARTMGYEIFKYKSPEAVALEAAGIAVKMLDAVNAPAGSFPVVIGPAFGGVIFHEACGHGLEADAIIKDASVFKGKLNKKIASSILTAVDDSTLQHHWGSYAFDSEGYPSQKNILIEKGILKNYIFDYKSACKMKAKQTGNGRRQSYRDLPVPRMSNTYIECGGDENEAILKSVKNGIYAKEFAGGQVDTATGDFVFGISEGYLIKNGAISEPIKGATLIGNGPDILSRIEAIGKDLDFAPGFCGKAGQSITNEVGQPTILVDKITVGGTEI
jgi:TldD protein